MIVGTRCSVGLALLLALLTTLVSPSLSAQDKLIDLTVVGSGSDFKIQFLNSSCSDKAQEVGCIEVQKGESGTLIWELDSMGETYWMLTRFQFSADGVNWGDSRFPLHACNVKNFNLEARDQFTGNAASAMITGNSRKIMINNSNEEECQTHYRIYAMPKAGGMEIHSDSVPMISSPGGGSH
jgi:hypothetical protein